MSITDQPVAQHPMLGALAALEQGRAELGEANVWSLSDVELRDALPQLRRLIASLDAAEARMLADADRREFGDRDGHHDTAGWYAATTKTTKPAAKAVLRFARSLDSQTHTPVREALAAGGLMTEQARVIVSAIDRLADAAAEYAITADEIERAEEHLVSLAADHDAKELRILGNRIVEVIAPEIAEEYQRRLLEADEARAAASARFTIRADGAGMMRGSFAIPELAGAILKKHLDALAAPRHRAASGSDPEADPAAATAGTPVSRPLRLGDAFVEYIETRPVTDTGTPYAGGVPATVVVTVSHQTLTGELETAGVLDTGEVISAAAARRLACEAGIIPAVLGSRSQVLDLGRKARFHTEPQRIAIAHRDKGCAAQHCDWPPGMCHVHHRTPWSQGGETNIRDALMLCPRHHALAHHADYEMTDTHYGTVRFARRT